MNIIAAKAGQLLDENREFVLATIVSRHGSTPRMAGTRMIISAGGQTLGTIGGGMLIRTDFINTTRSFKGRLSWQMTKPRFVSAQKSG